MRTNRVSQAPAIVAALNEANTLLGATMLRTEQARWMCGELVDVLVSPLVSPPGSKEAGLLVTVACRHASTELAGAAVEVQDALGTTTRTALDPEGHATVHVSPGFYRLSIRPPSAVTPCADMSSEARHRRRRHPSHMVTRIAAAILPVLLLAAALTILRDSPAEAVEVRRLTGACPARAGSEGGRGDRHVEVAASWGYEERNRFKRVLQRFAAATGMKVTLAYTEPATADGAIPPDRDLGHTLMTRIERECPPDVALLPQTGLLRDLATQGRLVPIEGVAGALVDQNYSRAWRQLASVGTTLYGVWFKASNKSLIWYNTHAFRKAGITEVPTHWDGLMDAARKLLAAGITPFSIGGADGWTLTDWFENVYLRTAGRERYEQLARGEIAWTDESVKEALRVLAEVFASPHWLAGGTAGALTTTFEGSVKRVFSNPRTPEAAMVFEGDFVASVVDETAAKVGTDALFFPFPSIQDRGSDNAVVGIRTETATGEATGGDVAVLLDQSEESEQLLRFLATPEAAEPWIAAGGFLSPNRQVDPAAYPNPASRTAAAAIASTDPVSFDLSDQLPAIFGSNQRGGMWVILQDFLAHPADVNRIAEELERSFREASPVPR